MKPGFDSRTTPSAEGSTRSGYGRSKERTQPGSSAPSGIAESPGVAASEQNPGVCVLVSRIDSLTYTLVKALTAGGYPVWLTAASDEDGCQLGSRLSASIASMPGVTMGSLEAPAAPRDAVLLIIQGHPHDLAPRSIVDDLARQAKCITIISTGDRRRPYRKALARQWQELRTYGRWVRKVTRVAYKDGFYPVDLFGVFRARRVVGFDVHSKFLQDSTAYHQIHSTDWSVEEKRPVRANFLGSQDPARRKRILDAVRPWFAEEEAGSVDVSDGKTMFWHEYTDDTPNVLSVREYIDVLTQSDFTLCPPGYYLLTHRPMEALLRGSIPVLHSRELDLYDVGLRDGVNCIGVGRGGWPAAMERLRDLDEDEIVRMRGNIRAIWGTHLEYQSSAKRMRNRLGLER